MSFTYGRVSGLWVLAMVLVASVLHDGTIVNEVALLSQNTINSGIRSNEPIDIYDGATLF